MAEYINRDLIVKNSMLHTWKKADLLRAIKEAPTLDVVPREEVVRIFAEIDSTIDLICAMTGVDIAIFGKYAELKKKYTEDRK